PQEGERLLFTLSTGLLNKDGQAGEVSLDLLQWQKGNARRQDGRLQHRVHRPIKAEEVAQPAYVQYFDLKSSSFALILAGSHAELGVAAGVAQHLAANA